MEENFGLQTLGVTPPEIILGATPPEIILKSLNTGLTNSHIQPFNPYAYTYTRALVQDLEEIFHQQKSAWTVFMRNGFTEKQ